jgi:hypothetical protein
MRTILPFVFCGSVVCLFAGCSHMFESRVVQAFAESIKAHDVARLKTETSADFEEKAVKGDDTFRALSMLDLPEGMPKVVSVKPIKDEEGKKVVAKRVVATIGKEKRKLVFRLAPDQKTGRWVVDDLFLSREDEGENKSVATRLSVLLALHESLDAWKAGEREPILAAATAEFRESLSQLTPGQLANFAKKCTSELADETRILPDPRIGEETSELRVAKSQSELILKFRRDGQHWKLDDLALESRRSGEDIASARQVAAAMSAAHTFEAAYRGSDKRTLQRVCTRQFFDGCLASADLRLVRLPEPGPGLDAFDVKLEESTATFVVPAGGEVLKISMTQQKQEELHAAPRFLVSEVTIYDLNSTQDKRLSSLFTAHATMESFAAALATRDIARLKANATHDFNQRVWMKTGNSHFDGLPMTGLAPAKPRIVQTRFQGSLTEILVEQGETPLTYILREEGGRMLVDDVLSPASGWPESMKLTAEILIPVLNFTGSLSQWTERHAEKDMDIVRASSTVDFSKFAWNNLDVLTDFEPSPASFFKAPLSGISVAGDRADVVFGNSRHGARFSIIKEAGAFKVDDVTLVAGPLEDDQVALKRTIRTQLAQGGAR